MACAESDCSISGRHKVRDKTADPEGLQRGHCRVCGYPVVRTLATRRWMISAYLG